MNPTGSEHRCLVCEPGRHADIWLTRDDLTLDELAGILHRGGHTAHQLRPATPTETALLGLVGRLWISFPSAA